MNTFWEQMLALAVFFVFPALQYVLLKWHVRRDGKPELWYLPAFGFRLVIRNLPRKKTLSQVHYRAILRECIPPREGASVITYMDTLILEQDDMFLFSGVDQVMIAFRLGQFDSGDLQFVHTDKLGKTNQAYIVTQQSTLVVDYTANVENWFNFDIQVAKRTELTGSRMREVYDEIQMNKVERRFELSRIRSVG